jgi:hypothetical protein
MVERTGPIRDDIEATRASMTDKMERIEGQVRDKVDSTVQQARQVFDLRHQVNERPWVAVGAALTLGFLVGSMGGGDDEQASYPAQPGQPMRYYSQQGYSSAEDRSTNPPAYGGQQYNGGPEARRGQLSGAVAQIADPMREELSVMAAAAVRSAMRVLREGLQDSIPQFDKEYRAVQSEREDDDRGELSERAVGASETTGQTNEAAFRARQS